MVMNTLSERTRTKHNIPGHQNNPMRGSLTHQATQVTVPQHQKSNTSSGIEHVTFIRVVRHVGVSASLSNSRLNLSSTVCFQGAVYMHQLPLIFSLSNIRIT